MAGSISGKQNVYLFLSGKNWQVEADKNSDGIITYDEFNEYLKDTDLNQEDIDAFFASADTNRTGKTRGIDNVLSLNQKELEALGVEMQDYVALDQVLDLIKDSGWNNFTGQDSKDWNAKIEAGLFQALIDWQKDGRKCGDFYTYMTTDSVGMNRLNNIVVTATAEVQLANVIERYEQEVFAGMAKFPEPYRYDINEDAELDAYVKNKVAEYISKNNITSIEAIGDHVKNILNDIEEYVKEYFKVEQDITIGNDGITTDPNDEELDTPLEQSYCYQQFNEKVQGLLGSLYSTYPDCETYPQITQNAIEEYIKEALEGVDTKTELEALLATDKNTIIEGIYSKAQPLIEEEKRWSGLKAKVESWFNDNAEKIIEELDTDKLIDIARKLGLLDKIKSEILDVKTFFAEQGNNITDDELNKLLTSYTTKRIIEELGSNFENGYGYDIENYATTTGYDYEKYALDTYNLFANATSFVDDSNLTNDEKERAYAQFAVGYFKDIAGLGEEYKQIVINIVGKNYSSVNALCNTANSYNDILKWTLEVKNAVKNDITDIGDTDGTTNPDSPHTPTGKSSLNTADNAGYGQGRTVGSFVVDDKDTWDSSKDTAREEAKKAVKSSIDAFISTLKSKGIYDSKILDMAADTAYLFFTRVIDACSFNYKANSRDGKDASTSVSDGMNTIEVDYKQRAGGAGRNVIDNFADDDKIGFYWDEWSDTFGITISEDYIFETLNEYYEKYYSDPSLYTPSGLYSAPNTRTEGSGNGSGNGRIGTTGTTTSPTRTIRR